MPRTPVAIYLTLLLIGSLECHSEPKSKTFKVEKGISLFAKTVGTVHAESRLQCAIQCSLMEACDAVVMSLDETYAGSKCHLKNGSTVAAKLYDSAYRDYTTMYAGIGTLFFSILC